MKVYGVWRRKSPEISALKVVPSPRGCNSRLYYWLNGLFLTKDLLLYTEFQAGSAVPGLLPAIVCTRGTGSWARLRHGK